MEGYTKLQKTIHNSLKQAAEESSMLLGQDLQIRDADVVKSDKKTYFGDVDDSFFVVGVESREEYPGQFFIIFMLRDAIGLSGTLLGIPPARIAEKERLLIMEKDDNDAFSEIANQLIGSINSIFQSSFPKKVHLKQIATKPFNPLKEEMTPEEPIPDGEYLLFMAPMEMPEHELGKLAVLVPVGLANAFDPQESAAPAPKAEAAAEGAAEEEKKPDAEAAAEKPANPPGGGPIEEGGEKEAAAEAPSAEAPPEGPMMLVLENDSAEGEKLKACLSPAGLPVVIAPRDTDVREIMAKGEVKLVFVAGERPEDGEFAACQSVRNASRDVPLPVILCASEWTRYTVMKAIKSGANAIVLRPYKDEDLLSKVEKLLKAA